LSVPRLWSIWLWNGKETEYAPFPDDGSYDNTVGELEIQVQLFGSFRAVRRGSDGFGPVQHLLLLNRSADTDAWCFVGHLTIGAMPVFFNSVFLFYSIFCVFLSQTVDEPIFCPG
jgi:hypothetical protein